MSSDNEDVYSVDENGVVPDAELNPGSEDIEKADDNNELVELRGEGRYFGTGEENLGPVCRNCHGRGHIAKNCKCDVCGKRDEHYTRQCPTAQKCSNCGGTGHLRSACKHKTKYIFCPRCDSQAHTEARCPLIWRSYITKGHKNPDIKYPEVIACYNCAGRGHYGDDCPEPRKFQMRFVEQSAFNGNNLARPLRRKYQTESRRVQKPGKKANFGGRFAQKVGKVKDRAKKAFRR